MRKASRKITLTEDYLTAIAGADISATAYKALILLITKPSTAAQIADKLGIQRQNASRLMKELQENGLIEEDRTEGRNKFMKAVTNAKKITTAEEQNSQPQ